MIYLRNSERYNDVIPFRFERGKGAPVLSGEAPPPGVEPSGLFADLSGKFAALFADKGQLFVHLDNVTAPLAEIEITVNGPRIKRTVVVSRKGGPPIAQATYEVRGAIPGDPTPFVEDEDFDFGLFLANVAKDPKRQEVMLRQTAQRAIDQPAAVRDA